MLEMSWRGEAYTMNEPTDTEMLDWMSAMAEACEGHVLSRCFIPDGRPLREKIAEMMKLNPI